jgi:cell division protein FtsL
MTRWHLLLLLALVLSSLFLVRTSYQARDLFFEKERALAQARRLDEEFKRLDAERQAQARNLRVEAVAREKLQMRQATPGVTQYVKDSAKEALSGGLR